MTYILMTLLKAYRLVISPLYGDVCRYWPSCSAYAMRALEQHGAARGTWLAARRLGRCHPWAQGGYDPVPGTPEALAWEHEQTGQDCRTHDHGTDRAAGHGPRTDRTGAAASPASPPRRTTNRALGPMTRA